jgi:hypothetical protein
MQSGSRGPHWRECDVHGDVLQQDGKMQADLQKRYRNKRRALTPERSNFIVCRQAGASYACGLPLQPELSDIGACCYGRVLLPRAIARKYPTPKKKSKRKKWSLALPRLRIFLRNSRWDTRAPLPQEKPRGIHAFEGNDD